MTMTWIVQAAVISLVAALGLGVAIRFSLMTRVQDRSSTRRVAPQVGNIAGLQVAGDSNLRRAPNA